MNVLIYISKDVTKCLQATTIACIVMELSLGIYKFRFGLLNPLALPPQRGAATANSKGIQRSPQGNNTEPNLGRGEPRINKPIGLTNHPPSHRGGAEGAGRQLPKVGGLIIRGVYGGQGGVSIIQSDGYWYCQMLDGKIQFCSPGILWSLISPCNPANPVCAFPRKSDLALWTHYIGLRYWFAEFDPKVLRSPSSLSLKASSGAMGEGSTWEAAPQKIIFKT